MGIRDHPIAPRSPWQNGYVERLIGSIRRECLDHIMILGEDHLRRVLEAYAGQSSADGVFGKDSPRANMAKPSSFLPPFTAARRSRQRPWH